LAGASPQTQLAELTYSTPPDILLGFKGFYTSMGRRGEGGQGLRREGKEGEWEGENGRREGRGSLGREKGGRENEGINLPHGRLKPLAALKL